MVSTANLNHEYIVELADASFGWPVRGGENSLLDENDVVILVCIFVYTCICMSLMPGYIFTCVCVCVCEHHTYVCLCVCVYEYGV